MTLPGPESNERGIETKIFVLNQDIAPFQLATVKKLSKGYPNPVRATFQLKVEGLPPVPFEITYSHGSDPLSASSVLPRFGGNEIFPGSQDVFKELTLQAVLPGRIIVAQPEERHMREDGTLVYRNFKPYDPRDFLENPSTRPSSLMLAVMKNSTLTLGNIFIRFYLAPGELEQNLKNMLLKPVE